MRQPTCFMLICSVFITNNTSYCCRFPDFVSVILANHFHLNPAPVPLEHTVDTLSVKWLPYLCCFTPQMCGCVVETTLCLYLADKWPLSHTSGSWPHTCVYAYQEFSRLSSNRLCQSSAALTMGQKQWFTPVLHCRASVIYYQVVILCVCVNVWKIWAEGLKCWGLYTIIQHTLTHYCLF